MTNLTDRLAALSDDQRRILLARLRPAPAGTAPAGTGSAGTGPAGTGPTRRRRRITPAGHRTGTVPLSFTQERIWFLEQFAPGSPLHNMSGVARIPMPIDAGVFADCLAEVVARHDSLRTRFVLRDGEPAGVVDTDVPVPLRVLPDLPEADLAEVFREEARMPFDVCAGPLLRACLVPAEDSCHIQLTMHHMVSDGYSNSVFFRELGALIGARLTGTRAQLADVPFQFADYAAWERAVYSDDSLRDQVAFWTEHLRGAPRVLALPADRPRPARMTYRGERLPLCLPAGLADRIRAVSRRHGVTPFVTVLAAFAVALGRFSGQDDLIVGVPVANRDEVGTERLIGPFLNTIALRVELTEDLTVAGLLSQVGTTMLDGYEHQGVPFERVLSSVQTTRDPSRSPLFQAVVNFQADQSTAAGTPGGVELRDIHNGGCQVDVLLNLTTSEHGIQGHIDYYADVYDEASIARLAESWLCVLAAMADDASAPVAELPLVPDREVTRLVEQASATEAGFDAGSRVPEVVLAPGRDCPDRVAIIGEAGPVTFGALDVRSAALARLLRDRVGTLPAGAAPHVALCLPRSADMILAILGVLRAGLAYVPLDPGYPRDRLAFICRDAGIAALVTRSDLRNVLPDVDVPAIELDRLPSDPLPSDPPAGNPAAGNPAGQSGAQPCAYTIYTSGSTGLPKGVSVSHRNVVNFLRSMQARPGMTRDDVLLAVTSPSFDIAVLEMLLPLAAGARVVVASPQDAADGTALARLMDQHGVTIMQATPATWQLLLDSGWTGRAGLRVLCGGEAIPPSLADALVRRSAEVWNMYGPTETTIWSTMHQITAADAQAGVIPIGTPIANTTAFVLDRALHPVPATVPGELCLGGDGVTLGYHGRPDLTGERYVRAPFWPGHRLYRTGDVVRARPDGTLEYLGRSDSQVKLRGYRIELGEIEAVLESCPGVARAVAVISGEPSDEPDGKAIVAYLQPAAAAQGADEDAAGIEPARVREFLRERLPEYMIPARFLIVTEFRMTPNGKIDRKNLPEPADPGDGGGQTPGSPGPGRDRPAGYVAPRTPTEQVLAAVWADLLHLPEIGVDDSFFEIGGHSLLATKLVFRVRETFGVDLPLVAFFDGKPTIERLADIVDRLSSGAGLPEAASDLDLAAEAVLPDDIRPAPGGHVHSVRHPAHPLLTGATGFVGAFLLAELLSTTQASVFCLVRAPSGRDGLDRIEAAMTDYGIWDPPYAERIIPVNGSLSQDRLGLGRPQWDHLAATVDVIYHCGADVNFVKPYRALRPANVTGTADILRLACDGSVKPVHFVSTTYVFDRFSYPAGTEFTEGMQPVHNLANTFGYTQSKWVSEQMVLQAGQRGLPVWIYRVGRVAGHSASGACQTYDFVWQAIRVGIEMGVAPVMDMSLDITPVDYVATSIVHLSRQPALSGQVFHVVSKAPLPEPDLVGWLDGYGYHSEHVSFAEWRQRVIERAARLDDDAAGALAPFLSGALPLERIPAARFDDQNVTRGLDGSAITCPPIDDGLLRTYIDYFTGIDYLPAPPGPAGQVPAGKGEK